MKQSPFRPGSWLGYLLVCCVGLWSPSCRSTLPPKPDALLTVTVVLSPLAENEGVPPLLFIDDHPVKLYPGAGAPSQSSTKVPLYSGFHRLEVQAPGCFPLYREVSLPKQGQRDLHLRLRPNPEGKLDLDETPRTRFFVEPQERPEG